MDIDDRDYLDLWKYFQDRADNIKGAMFQSVTWAIGFAGAVLGYIVTQVDVAGIAPETIVGAAFLGLLLCGYSLILIAESKKHILRNWDRADYCKRQVTKLNMILSYVSEQEKLQKAPMAYVWNQVLCVVGAFAMVFVAALIWALEDQHF